jgi:hypothetical protein
VPPAAPNALAALSLPAAGRCHKGSDAVTKVERQRAAGLQPLGEQGGRPALTASDALMTL